MSPEPALLAKIVLVEDRLELARSECIEKGALEFRSPEVMPRLKHLDLRGMWYDASHEAATPLVRPG